jgi:DNA invertase Pin-like site-specific DNA recombinase
MAVAEFERGIIRERVNSGLAAAKARGVQLGRPSTINGRVTEIRKLKAKGFGLRAIARELKMPPSSVHKALQLAA